MPRASETRAGEPSRFQQEMNSSSVTFLGI
jgi:hypothetical protein